MSQALPIAIAAAVFAVGLTAPALADTEIACPLDSALRTITDPLPAGWWTTPHVQSLSDTEVSEIEGLRALRCLYGEAGAIQRYEPRGEHCTATPEGFSCVSAPIEPGRLRVEGGLRVLADERFNLDDGSVGDTSADLWWRRQDDGAMVLVPVDAAEVATPTAAPLGLDGCSAADLSSDPVPAADLAEGTFLCVRTAEGRLSEILMGGFSEQTPDLIYVDFTTWE